MALSFVHEDLTAAAERVAQAEEELKNETASLLELSARLQAGLHGEKEEERPHRASAIDPDGGQDC
jgi:hypothetical protein